VNVVVATEMIIHATVCININICTVQFKNILSSQTLSNPENELGQL
jgi:hypothetical protein